MNKTILIAASAAVTLLLTSGALKAESTPSDTVDEAKKITQQFAGQLQSELKSAMENAGPVKAVDVCAQRAPAIAAGLSKSTGWEIARTSLKTRNTELNTPDSWERKVLEQFDARQGAGEDVATMAYAEVLETNDGKHFRFMKAIPTGELCLACHGTQINPDIATALDAHYPDDQARGYTLGEVRGAFSLLKPL